MIPLVGFLPPTTSGCAAPSPRSSASSPSTGSCCATRRGDVADGLPPGEGCSSRARSGSPTTSRSWARPTRRGRCSSGWSGLANDVGLLAEEYDPQGKRLLGNFPQAFTHVALVNTACNLSATEAGPARRRAHVHRTTAARVARQRRCDARSASQLAAARPARRRTRLRRPPRSCGSRRRSRCSGTGSAPRRLSISPSPGARRTRDDPCRGRGPVSGRSWRSAAR